MSKKYTHKTLKDAADHAADTGYTDTGLFYAHVDSWEFDEIQLAGAKDEIRHLTTQLAASQERVRDLEALLGDARGMLGLPRTGPWETPA